MKTAEFAKEADKIIYYYQSWMGWSGGTKFRSECVNRLTGIGAEQYTMNAGTDLEQQKFETMSGKELHQWLMEKLQDAMNYVVMLRIRGVMDVGMDRAASHILHAAEELGG